MEGSERNRKEKTTAFGDNFVRSLLTYWAAQKTGGLLVLICLVIYDVPCLPCSSAASSSPDDTPRQADLPYPMSAWSWEQQSSAADWMVIPTGEAGLGLQVSDLSHLIPSSG